MTEEVRKREAGTDGGATLGELAQQLRMSATTVRRWARNGWLPSTIRADGERRFDRTLTAIVPLIAEAEPPIASDPESPE